MPILFVEPDVPTARRQIPVLFAPAIGIGQAVERRLDQLGDLERVDAKGRTPV